MFQQLKHWLDRQSQPARAERILGRQLARELTDEEIDEVAGANCCHSTDGKCDCYA